MPNISSGDDLMGSERSLQDDGKLWSNRFEAGLNQSGGGGLLDFMNKKAEDGAVGTISANHRANIGAGYRLIQNEDTSFLGRFGGGLSQEYTGLEEGRRIPEVLMGVELEHQLTQRSKIVGAVEYAHDLTESGRYRTRTQAAWEVLLDPDRNISLRTGFLESFNKTPNGERTKGLDYTMDFIWKF